MVRCFYGELRLEECTHEDFFNGPRVTDYRFCLQFSPLMILRLCFVRDPTLSRLEEAFIASGASACSKCTRVSVVIRDKGGRHDCLDLNLSEQQGDDFIEALPWRPHWGLSPRVQHQIEKLFQELDLPQLYDEAADEETLQENVFQEVSEEDEVNTEDEDTSDEWSTVSSDSLDAPDAETDKSIRSSHSPSQSP